MKWLTLLTVAGIAGGALPVHAEPRSCTPTETAQADARLIEISQSSQLRKKFTQLHLKFGAPVATGPTANERILVADSYVVDHDDDLRTTIWVGYRLTARDVIDGQGLDRVDCFRRDPRIPSAAAANPADYKEPRFDQGHMANDADMKDVLIDQINTYVMSNMSPQECKFNRGIWLSLESLTRVWASKFHTVYVTSGAIFDRNGDSIRDDDSDAVRMKSNSGKKRVAVPSQYYKVILRKDQDGFHSIAFLLDHTKTAHGVKWADVRPDVENAITTIEEIEDKSDLKLFPDLDRDEIEQSPDGEGWSMDKNASNLEGGCQ